MRHGQKKKKPLKRMRTKRREERVKRDSWVIQVNSGKVIINTAY
jgi:hypothetical protein